MPEILTESFCERCGTRYTFESVAPRKARRLGQFKTLSRGVKNWVLSDDSSLDEALAAARGDQEREVTTQQLDAFHSTFNFCMSCRQYTCANCWNEVEGRCLSCAPGIAQEILQAPVPSPFAAGPAEATRLDVGAWPETDLSGPAAPPTNVWGFPEPTTPTSGNGSNGAANGHSDSAETPAVEAEDDLPSFDAAARLAFLAGEEVPAADAGAGEQGATGGAEETIGDPWRDLDDRAAGALTETDAAALEAESLAGAAAATIADASGTEVEDEAAAGANRTTELLSRFRPGQSIDDALAAYEADLEFRRLDEEVASEPPSVPVAAAEPEAMAEALPEIEQIGTSAPDLREAFAAEPEPAPPAREPEIVAAVADAILTDDAPRALPVAAAPEGADVEAGSADVELEPVAVEREPVAVAPEADVVAVEPVAVAPEPVSVAPEPVSVAPQPIAVAPEADEVAVEPVGVAP
ncbi:MAG TPA: hypothetical protein VGO64_02985, partial [Candidatus Limnocylindrales bacterium]|nr:hypothetical protein [Candidatus Limnocylindrales bacterium]